MRNLQRPGRSPVHSVNGMACTSHPLSSQTAIDILKAGGNAMDAAVAACAVQCVVEPEMTGIGGDCFCLFAPNGQGAPVAFNGSGRAPAAATPEWYAANGIEAIERQSPHAVTVPGAVDAWQTLIEDHGRMSLGELLQPAIAFAQEGYPISSRVHVDFCDGVELLKNDANASAVFLPDGNPPKVGAMHRQPKLAATFEAIAEGGRDAFYKGAVAEDIVGYLQSKDGLHTMEDFAAVNGNYVDPISVAYGERQLYQCPPNGQGVIALLLLNMMEGLGSKGDDPAALERVHLELEAIRIAYGFRDMHLADPDQASVPVEWFLSKETARELRGAIDPERAGDSLPDVAPPPHSSTIYLTVVDKDRNACSFINSLFNGFGSGLMAPQSGVLLHNRGQGFTLAAGHPNCIAPGKRPLHTLIPGMVTQADKVTLSYGVMGGQYQAAGHMQFLTRLFDYELDIQEALDAPRFFADPFTGDVGLEDRIPDDVVQALVAKGHRASHAARPIGGGQAIAIDWEQNVLTGGSDPRKDGCAIGY